MRLYILLTLRLRRDNSAFTWVELGLQLVLTVGKLTPVHIHGSSGSRGIPTAQSKGNRTCLLTLLLEHSPDTLSLLLTPTPEHGAEELTAQICVCRGCLSSCLSCSEDKKRSVPPSPARSSPLRPCPRSESCSSTGRSSPGSSRSCSSPRRASPRYSRSRSCSSGKR